jgi:hypothetical protein
MASLEVRNNNLDKKQIQDTLFSKDNISLLNNQILEKFKLKDTNKDNKKKIIEVLVKHMKFVYKSLDLSKINSANFKSIMNQFNKASLEQSGREIGSEDVLKILSPNASQLKFERDFHSNPNSGNKMMDRPQAVSNKSNQQFLYPPGYENKRSNNLDPKFDKLFKPIVDNMNDNYSFNQYQNGKGGEEFGKNFDKLMSERDVESTIPKRPATPDFLKPQQTSVRGIPENMSNSNKNSRGMPQPKKRSGKPNFSEDIPDDEKDMGFLSANDNNDLYDVNNIDKPLEIMEIQEDTRSFDQRLKSLERDRGNIEIKKPEKKINFQDPNLEGDDLSNFQPKSIDEIRREKNKNTNNESDSEDQPPNQQQQQLQLQLHQQQQKQQQLHQQQQQQQLQQLQQQLQHKQKLQLQQMQQQQLANSKIYRKVDMGKIKEALKKLKVDDNLLEMDKILKENESLKLKIKMFDDKTKFDYVKKEIGSEFTKLHEREKEIYKKEDEMKQLLKKYNYLYGLKHIQMDISPPTSTNKYTFEFQNNFINQVNNIIAIKLMSYSIPIARYNIEENKNNVFKIRKDDKIEEIKLNSGKYKIEDLLNTLNKKGNYKFQLNFEEKVEISNKDEDDKNTFEILSTPLSVEVLGFIKKYNDNTNYIADRTWDLRIEDKLYLFLNNINDEIPFAVLYLGNQAVQQWKFEEPFNLEKLEVEFKDSKNRPYNFYGLQYNINVQLEISDPKENDLIIN